MTAAPISRALPDPASEPTISVARWAAVLGVSTFAIRGAIQRGEIPAIWIGHRIVIPTARALAAAGLNE